ncbi:MAG: TetR/AcrR family transcriptional regulator [Rubrivivax sp.]|nr:MAG: TetR/AcrR family transcriptional regulator [Rubrivivax sp.]
MSKDRKTTVADAALELLGSVGARGLTHRAVDALAGLPAGSTSSCCRTRLDLLTLALNRHAARNLDDLAQDAARLSTRAPSIDAFIETLVDRLEDWMSPAKRPRVVAQIEIFLIASREPTLQAVVEALHQHFVDATVQALRHLRVAEPEGIAMGLIATVDGILHGQIVNSHMRPDRATCKAMLMRAVQALPAKR